MSITFNINAMRLYNGRRSFFASFCVRIGERQWRRWVQRWDVERTQPPKYHPRFLTRDGVMGWTWGGGFAI